MTTPLDPAIGTYEHLDAVTFDGASIPEDDPDAAEGTEEDPEAPATTVAATEAAPPKARVVPEAEAAVISLQDRQVLEPVKFRLKTEAPNPAQPATGN